VKLITRNTDYAVRALISIAKNKEKIVPVTRLVQELKIPKAFLRKILQILNKKGILNSYKGIGGGFRLAASPDKIFLLDLVEIFQGELKLNECMFRKRICANREFCELRARICDIERFAYLKLKSANITSLIKRR
jgi:Rrf2 family protein